MKFNDLEIEKWKDSDINTDSLWLIGERNKTGKHSNKYHGNFIPQIPFPLSYKGIIWSKKSKKISPTYPNTDRKVQDDRFVNAEKFYLFSDIPC